MRTTSTATAHVAGISMPEHPLETTWDFGAVYDLIHNLDVDQSTATAQVAPSTESNTIPADASPDQDKPAPSLGDFSKIWKYLDVPKDIPPPIVPPVEVPPLLEPSLVVDKGQDSLESGSATDEPRAAKTVRFVRDQTKEERLESYNDALKKSKLAKKAAKQEQKRLRRAEKKAKKELAKEKPQETTKESLEDSSALATPGKTIKILSRDTPKQPNPRYNLRSNKQNANSLELHSKPDTPNQFAILDLLSSSTSKTKQKPMSPTKPEPATPTPVKNVRTPTRGALLFTPSSVFVSADSRPLASSRQTAPKELDAAQQATTTMSSSFGVSAKVTLPGNLTNIPHTPLNALRHMSPSTVTGSLAHKPSRQQLSSTSAKLSSSQPQSTSNISTIEVVEHTVKDEEDRHLEFLLQLCQIFVEDKKWLVSPMQLSNNNTTKNGIHVFVDASNILIGFNDTMKNIYNIAPGTRTPNWNISFDSLVLLMERRRPVAKRVLVGSSPLLPAFETARAVGYEVNVLDKVYKVKELTRRQKFFHDAETYGFSKATEMQKARDSESSGSDSETITAAPVSPQKARWIEQGVDEILHLKMLESVVDSDTPSTIVLATGDAAEAEYSQGFMAMVVRALKKGWKVELISWSKNISTDYKKHSFLKKWGNAFRIISLDDFAENLLKF